MNRLLFYSHEREGENTVRLRGARARHVDEVLKLEVGDSLRVGELSGRIGVGVVQVRAKDELVIEVQLSGDSPAPSRLQVVLALPRPKACGRILESITEWGVKKIVLLHAAKVEKSYWQAHQLRPQEIEKHVLMGMQQAGDTVVPDVKLATRFRPFVEDDLGPWGLGPAGEPPAKWVLHPGAKWEPLPSMWTGPTVLAIGPEGGWTDFEVELFVSQGFRVGTFGTRTLSSETVLPAVLGRELTR